MNRYSYNTRLNPFLWIILPLIILVYPYLLNLPGFNIEKGINREGGFIEIMTVILLAVALFFGIRSARAASGIRRLFYAFLSLGAFYFLGEEISWGQHLFSWKAPESVANINEQKETNLHNLPGIYNEIFAKIPRLFLSVFSIVGGAMIPLYFQKRSQTFPPASIHTWIWPSSISTLTAILINTVSIPSKIFHQLDREMPALLNIEQSEQKECFIALFILLYMITGWKMISSSTAQTQNPPD